MSDCFISELTYISELDNSLNAELFIVSDKDNNEYFMKIRGSYDENTELEILEEIDSLNKVKNLENFAKLIKYGKCTYFESDFTNRLEGADFYYLLFELEDDNLNNYFDKLSDIDIRDIVFQLLYGYLSLLQNTDIRHNDISLSNILISRNKVIKNYNFSTHHYLLPINSFNVKYTDFDISSFDGSYDKDIFDLRFIITCLITRTRIDYYSDIDLTSINNSFIQSLFISKYNNISVNIAIDIVTSWLHNFFILSN